MSDWATSICVQEMFANGYPRIYRNNIIFNDKHSNTLLQIYQEINIASKMLDKRIDILKR